MSHREAEPFVDNAAGAAPVRGFLHRAGAGAGFLVLTHGAGGKSGDTEAERCGLVSQPASSAATPMRSNRLLVSLVFILVLSFTSREFYPTWFEL